MSKRAFIFATASCALALLLSGCSSVLSAVAAEAPQDPSAEPAPVVETVVADSCGKEDANEPFEQVKAAADGALVTVAAAGQATESTFLSSVFSQDASILPPPWTLFAFMWERGSLFPFVDGDATPKLAVYDTSLPG